MIDNVRLTGRWADPNIYGIDWNANDETPRNFKGKRVREKPFCEFPNCTERVSTEKGRPKPFCKVHVLENPYVQDMLKRYTNLDSKKDRAQAKAAFEKAKKEYDSDPRNN